MSASPDSQLNHMELDSGQYNEGLQDGNWNPQEPSSSSGKQECLRFASESAIGHWKWSAGRRRVRPDSELFQHGNTERELHAKQVSLSITPMERNHLTRLISSTQKFAVHVTNRPACSVCKCVFPSDHLLGLHVAECHDSFFQAQAARGYKVYECFVEACGKKFTSHHSRVQHLVDIHHFPKYFNFNMLNATKQRKRNRKKRGPVPSMEQIPSGRPTAPELNDKGVSRATEPRGSDAAHGTIATIERMRYA
mmetsp:Transcript_38693/g.109392  ORF Transcript_38693/g.109392 Transcript_38693/m.109392 type:complete len:251 (+) Transcript_38693:378-1130(+)